MLEEPGYLRSGKRYRVESEDHSFEHHPSSSRSVKSNPPVTSEEEGGLIPYRPTTLQKTLGEQGTLLYRYRVAVVVIILLVVKEPLQFNRHSQLTGTQWLIILSNLSLEELH